MPQPRNPIEFITFLLRNLGIKPGGGGRGGRSQNALGGLPSDPGRRRGRSPGKFRGKPILSNPDGSISTERTITIGADGKFFNIPTIVRGEDVGPKRAVELFRKKKNKPVGVFGTQAEAEKAARARSISIGDAFSRKRRGRKGCKT